MSKEEEHKHDYIIVPQEEYVKLYNRQYAELTMLKRKVDPEECHNTYLEATLKKHYPQVYKDMIKDDYIMTSGNRMEQDLQDANNQPEHQRRSIQMIKQLDEVVSGKYKLKKLLNPVRFFAQKYVDDIARESTLAPEKRRLLHTHLYQVMKKYPGT